MRTDMLSKCKVDLYLKAEWVPWFQLEAALYWLVVVLVYWLVAVLVYWLVVVLV